MLDRLSNKGSNAKFNQNPSSTSRELYALYSSLNINQVIKSITLRLAGHAAHMAERRRVYRVLMGKPERRRPLGRLRRRWEDNIKIDLREVGWEHGLDRSGSG